MKLSLTSVRFLFFAAVVLASSLSGVRSVKADPPITSGLTFWVTSNDLDGDGVPEGLGESGLTGNLVTTWVDKAPLQGVNTATQLSSSFRPILDTVNTVGGKPVVRFDGLDDFLASTTFTSALVQPNTVFLVWKADSKGGLASAAMDGLTAGSRHYISYETDNFSQDSIIAYSGLASITYPTSFSGPGVTTVEFNDPDNSPPVPDSKMWFNGSLVASGSTGNHALDGVTLGGRHAPFAGDRLTLDGYLAEVLIYDSQLSASDRFWVENYLADQYSIGGVPEPSSVALLGLGAALLVRVRSRKHA